MKTIHHVVDIDAPVERVWSALTDVTSLAGWWSTKVEQAGGSGVGSRLNWTFAGDFNPVMEITAIKDGSEIEWVCVSGHEPWQDGQFRFAVTGTGDGRTRLRFWQEYAVELADDYYGVYNFNWGYYLESLRLLSTGDSTFKHDLGSEDADGNQDSAISVFTLDAGGRPRHFYTTHPRMSGDIDQRGIDLLSPLWHMLDLTPQGRGDWYASLDYGPHV